MRAHEWTRARQRPVRQIGRSLGQVAEEAPEPVPAAEPPLLTEEPPEEQPDNGLAPESAARGLHLLEPVAPETEPATLEEEAPVPPEPEAPPPGPPSARVSRQERPVTRRRQPPRQPQLPLPLDEVSSETTLRRTATETREDLIQRLLDPHLSLQETARLLNVCPTTVRRYTNRGLLAHYRTPGNQRRFRLSDVLAFMERQGIPAHGLERRRPTLPHDAGDAKQSP